MAKRCNRGMENAKGTFDPAKAERVLAEQNLYDFIDDLKEAGAL